MTQTRWILVPPCAAQFLMLLIALTAAATSDGPAQTRQLMKVKLGVLPSVSVAGMDAEMRGALLDEKPHLTTLVRDQTRGGNPVMLVPGFSILAYENIAVLLSVTLPPRTRLSKSDSSAVRVACGYLNDGTTYFRRATIADKNPIQFRLRNNSLLKRSMQFANPLFIAYVFFLVNQRQEAAGNDSSPPVMTVTVEYL